MLKEDFPLVSIITVTWNSKDVTRDFLLSINEQNTYPNIEIIVVDNGSAEDPTEALVSIRPDATIILAGQNLGFAGGNNVGIKQSSGDYIFLVNNDTEFTPHLIEGLIDIFKQYPDAGIVSPKFHYFFAKGTIEYAGYNAVNIFTGRNGMIGCKEIDKGQYDRIKVTHYAHGGGMMVSKEVIRKAGLLPELFFLYYEEFDWCEEIKRNGYKVYFQPNSLIYHKESVTTGKASPLKTYYQTRNRIIFMKRNVPAVNFFIFALYFVFFTIPKNSLIFFIKGQGAHLRSFWKAIMWQFNHSITFK